MVMIKREKYLSRIRPFYDSQYIKAITGIRRCGKSVLMSQIIEELKASGIDERHIIELNLEGKSGETITTRKKLEKALDKRIKDESKYYIFIDEVQHILKFEEAIASVRVSYNCSLFVTGSNSKLLKGKLQDRLTGRAKEFVISPFTYAEVLEFKRVNGIDISDDEIFDYLKWGGMPQRYEEIDEQGIVEYFQSLYHSIIEKDVYHNHKKINRAAFENVSDYIIMTSGRTFSASNIARYLLHKVDDKELKSAAVTVSNYQKYISECFLVTECKPYFIQGKQALNGTKKLYAIDLGIRSSFSNTIDTDDTFGLENLIFNELKSRGYDVKSGIMRNGEIDFVVIKGTKKCFIQVAYYLYKEETINREYGALEKVKSASPKYVFSLDKYDSSRNGITHINIVDFLTGKIDINFS